MDDKINADSNVVSYYRNNNLNPVPIDLQMSESWKLHVEKRRNLYQRHLGVPLSLLRGRSVLEFGCNSGENALVLAHFGADVTLVEPNELVMPRLKELFNQYGLAERITDLIHEDIDTFVPDTKYELVIAEGFVNTLDNRDEIFSKVCSILSPGGLAIISFDDCYGHLIELTRKLVFWRVFRLEGAENAHGSDSLDLAKRLYLQDFRRLNASRPFEAWWGDVLLNPFVATKYLWSFQEILPLLDKTDCEFYSSSPSWVSTERFTWYKNVVDKQSRHQGLLDEWLQAFPFFLTGLPPAEGFAKPAPSDVVDAVFELTLRISEYIDDSSIPISSVTYPLELDEYLGQSNDPRLVRFNENMKALYKSVCAPNATVVESAYHEAGNLRDLWGAPCHYVCLSKSD